MNETPKILNPFTPKRERYCDKIADSRFLEIPPTPPPVPKPPRVKKPKVWTYPPKFALLTNDFYNAWCSHKKNVLLKKNVVDSKPPVLYPEMYLKPRSLNHYASLLQRNIFLNTELVKRINRIQRSGGYVDCWRQPSNHMLQKFLHVYRQGKLTEIEECNKKFYKKLVALKSQLPSCYQLGQQWKITKDKLILSSKRPFVLFETNQIDMGIKDPAFLKPEGFQRERVKILITVSTGAKLGRVTIELFTDVVPKTCDLFLSLVQGDSEGYAYSRTRIFRIVPGLYCRAGDVAKDNGFGNYVPNNFTMEPENYFLSHSIPGTLSMVVTKDDCYTGQFNIIFKPLHQFDGVHVVFGRIVNGPGDILKLISANGRTLGTTIHDVYLHTCQFYKNRQLVTGPKNQTKFFDSRKTLFLL